MDVFFVILLLLALVVAFMVICAMDNKDKGERE